VTLSLVDLTKLGPIEAAFNSLAAAYPNASAIAGVLGTVASGRQNAVEYAANPDPAQAYNLVDAWDLASKMPGVTGASALQSAVTGAVVYSVNGPAKAGSKGLSVYFPPTAANRNADYYPLVDTLPGMAGWKTFLEAVYGGGANEADPFFVGVTYTTTAGLAVTGTLDGATSGSARKGYLMYGLDYGAAGVALLGDQPAAIAGTSVTSTWDWTVPRLTQGTYEELGYLSVEQVSAGLYTASFPLWYVNGAAEEFALWQIAFSDTAVLSSAIYTYSGAGMAELAPAPGSTLHAMIQHMPSLDAWSFNWILFDNAGQGFDASQPIDLDFPFVTSGYGVAVVVRAENSAGAAANWIKITEVAP
jgi:hypothetical protein